MLKVLIIIFIGMNLYASAVPSKSLIALYQERQLQNQTYKTNVQVKKVPKKSKKAKFSDYKDKYDDYKTKFNKIKSNKYFKKIF